MDEIKKQIKKQIKEDFGIRMKKGNKNKKVEDGHLYIELWGYQEECLKGLELTHDKPESLIETLGSCGYMTQYIDLRNCYYTVGEMATKGYETFLKLVANNLCGVFSRNENKGKSLSEWVPERIRDLADVRLGGVCELPTFTPKLYNKALEDGFMFWGAYSKTELVAVYACPDKKWREVVRWLQGNADKPKWVKELEKGE